MKLFKNYRRAKRLLAEDDKRIEIEKAQRAKQLILINELKGFDTKHLDYIASFTEIDISTKEINLASVYRELNRVKLSIYVMAPTLYIEAFGKTPCIPFDTVYIRNADMSSYPKSLNEMEKLLSESSEKDNWPPQKIDLDFIDEAAYYSFHSSVNSDIKNLKKLLSIIATLQ